MKSTKNRFVKSTLGLAMLAVIASPLAGAQDVPYWYGGADIGRGNTDIDSQQIVPRLQQMGYATTSVYTDDYATAFKILAGYRFNKNFALEGSIFDLGNYGFQAVMNPSSNLAGKIRPMGWGLDMVGFMPLSDNNSLFARVGLNYAQVTEQFSARNLPSQPYPRTDNTDVNWKYGVGFQHDFSDNFAIRAEAERYSLDETVGIMDHVDMFSVGVVYRFGTKAAYVAPRQAPPAPVVAAPAPRPVPPPPPPAPVAAPKPAPVKITLSADSLFDFNSAALKPAGKKDLDKMASDLKSLDYDVITVTGHTDRIGAAKYNLKLSQRRAETVKDYLVNTARISSAKITATGVDGSQPVTRTDQCNNMANKAALIVCLQPDRRVEVEVVGTR